MKLPSFNEQGKLPPGIHEVSWPEFSERFGFNEHRRRLLGGLQLALAMLRDANCRQLYVDGSFVTAKEQPRDYDACWDVTGVDFGRIDKLLLVFEKGRAAQKQKYLGELFPATFPPGAGARTYLEFFQTDRESGERKGIVLLDPRRFR